MTSGGSIYTRIMTVAAAMILVSSFLSSDCVSRESDLSSFYSTQKGPPPLQSPAVPGLSHPLLSLISYLGGKVEIRGLKDP